MPIRVANTIVKRLSKQLYYNYGKAVASRTHLLLLFSFTFISYFSLPAITKYYHEIITPTIYNNIPLSHLSTSLDAQCWHASAHVQFSNFSTSRHPPSEYLITEQIRLSHPDQPVTFDLIQHARQIYESISTTIITVDEDPSPVSLASICYKHHSHCLVHAPPFVQFRDADEWRTKTVLDHTHTQTQYETHPYSVYSNATFDHQGRFLKADAVLLTFVLRQNKNGNAIRIWNKLLQEVKSKYNIVDFETQPTDASYSIWAAPSNTVAHTIQYKFDLFPYDISYKVQVSILAYIIIFYLVSMTFSKSNLVKSSYSFGLAAVFLSIACFTTTWGIMDRLGITLNHVPWYLLLVVVNIGCLENIFLLTNAVLYAGCDMEVIEKISRGLQSVGVPMTATLIAELFILNVGKHMDTLLIQEFCIFAQLALIVDFILQATFVVAVLSIDIKRVELTDLDDRQTSKRLHELANYEFDKKQTHHADFCPIQDTHNKQNSKSCAECKEFKTHRVLNAFMLCLILLVLSLICTKEINHHHHHHQLHLSSSSSTSLTSTVDSLSVTSDPFIYQPNLNQLSNQFWSTVNPEKDVTWLHIQPVQLFVYSSDRERVQEHIDYLQHLYQVKTTGVRYNPEYRPSLFRIFILSIMKGTFKLLSSINIPVLILCLVMIGIITWMTPKWRKEWLVPLMIQCFNQSMLALIQWFRVLMQFSKRIYHAYSKKQPFGSSNKEYDANGHHRGAITAQSLFNQQQYKANVKQVHVRTLTHQHAADIQDLDFSAKHSLVSCDQDGRIVLWHADNANPTWMARLDRLHPIRGGLLQAILNPDYYAKKKSNHHHSKQQRKQKSSRSLALSSHLSKARCVKIDQGNKWVAAGFDDGLIRVWNANTGTLVREMDIHPSIPLVEIQQEPTSATLRRRLNGNESPTLSYSSVTSSFESKKADRVLSLEYVGAIAEFCHPSIAEAAARCGSSEIEVSQNFIVSIHKSGLLHEWNILSGECIQTIKTGHTKDITQLHVVDSKAPYRKQGITWVFTASKDGTVKCWERRLIQKKQTAEEDYPLASYPSEDEAETQQTRWNLIYTLKQDSPVTSIATELPVGGMGVLVTGCANASVKVWNFETGELICTLSSGKTALSSASSVASANSSLPRDAINIGGPIRRFSRFSNRMAANATSNLSSDEEDASDSSCSSVNYRSSLHSASDHKGSIQQVVVTRYCEVENGPGLCRGCDTCFGSGFLVASSCTDNKVHAWRLERSDSGYEGPCALCTKDYHRKQYKHRKASTNSSDDGSVEGIARKSAAAVGRNRKRVHHSASPMVKKRQVSGRPLMDAFNNQESMDSFELLDIEQLAGDVNISLQSTFLGKIDQVAGQALVFCDNILAGVRRRRHHHHTETSKLPKSEWEVWFASLQYYDPSLHKDDDTEESNHMRIPTEVFDLEDDVQTTLPHSKRDKKEEEHYKAIQLLKGTLLNLFTSSSSPSSSPLGHQEPLQRDHALKYKRIHAYSSESSDDDTRKDQEEDLIFEEENLDAGENLPFSTVRRIVSLDGSGLACDFGNFIKLIYLDRPSLTDKERSKQLRQTIEDFGVSHQHIIDQAVVEENEEADGAPHGEGNACSMENRGKDGCCGGTNKDKNSGKCCGGMTKQKQQERRHQRALKKKPQVAATCGGGANGIIECSLKNSCSRASECASNSQAIATNASIPSFSNWL